MLEFSHLKLSDIDTLRPLILQGNSGICNNTVGGIFMWRDYFNMEYAKFGDTVVFKARAKYNGVDTVFSLPLGSEFQGGINKTADYCRSCGLPIAFYAVTDDDVEPIQKAFGSSAVISKKHTNEDWDDYIYEAAALKSLEGRKYSGKRNHINQFKKEYTNWAFDEITSQNIAGVREFYRQYSAKLSPATKTAIEDHNKTIEVLDNYELYGLLGGLLKVNDAIVAFSLGESKADVLHIHTEKADIHYKGVYQVINNEFAKHFATPDIKFINREEDDGDPGLRFSKNSYHPCKKVSKYILIMI
ncbi:MAG: phosphatidylglycerol lysyltransferase domain-containing protein [Oscillospiraceae bacterium]|nr:phosphatidylglycerol lysyltransferase domain-containing protein [Oscillospiraceae bacterium]